MNFNRSGFTPQPMSFSATIIVERTNDGFGFFLVEMVYSLSLDGEGANEVDNGWDKTKKESYTGKDSTPVKVTFLFR
jgi:hypothetical protein